MNVQLPQVFGSGWIEVICGSMFSGKTEELIRRIKRAQIAKIKVQVFKPVVDSRFSEAHVTSHSALQWQATAVKHPEEILGITDDQTRIVAIDEAQFFHPSIVTIAQRLASRGLRVIVAGLDLDYRGLPFGPMPELMAVAELVSKMSAICSVCGAAASRTQRLPDVAIRQTEQVLVGASEAYEARCRRCFEPPL